MYERGNKRGINYNISFVQPLKCQKTVVSIKMSKQFARLKNQTVIDRKRIKLQNDNRHSDARCTSDFNL